MLVLCFNILFIPKKGRKLKVYGLITFFTQHAKQPEMPVFIDYFHFSKQSLMSFFSNRKMLLAVVFSSLGFIYCEAQQSLSLKLKKSSLYAGIEVGSKGVKLSLLEVGLNSQKESTFNILKDSSVNSDFISFTPNSFNATLTALNNLFQTATRVYLIPPSRIYTVVSSGVKVQSEKEKKEAWITRLADSFRIRVQDRSRKLDVVDVIDEARLSHLGIVPDSRRYSTFLIDIGSGNTKGGYFPNGNIKDFKLFQLSWGTKSTANATDKRLGDDKSPENYHRNVYRVLAGNADNEIVYAVNVSNAYNMSDYIAFSGGIAWATATLLFPELIDNPVVPVTFGEIEKYTQRILNNYSSLTDKAIVASVKDATLNKGLIASEVKRVNQVFDQKSLMAGAGLLLNIMRQFEGVYEKKQFYLVKNGQVGWISAYVNQNVEEQ